MILGSTGSIGRQAIDVVSAAPERFQVTALAAGHATEELLQQARRVRPRFVAVQAPGPNPAVLDQLESDGFCTATGADAVLSAAGRPDADIVLNAITGVAGLWASLAAIEAGHTLALANKETLVAGGALVKHLAREKDVQIVPVDSEPSAIWQCAGSLDLKDRVSKVILTASGGPFWNATAAELSRVTPSQALRHPTWRMGPKITVDSATLMNKALEVIEACWFFDLPPERVDVVIHPQSIVHSMVVMKDGSTLAQMAPPDMRYPILFALSYPERIDVGLPRLDLAQVGNLTFARPDPERFPALVFGYNAAKMGGTVPAILNAANEQAVSLFLQGELSFPGITAAVGAVLEKVPAAAKGASVPAVYDANGKPAVDREAIRAADAWARAAVGSMAARWPATSAKTGGD